MQIQSNLGSTIAMAFDECPPALAERKYVEDSVARTTRWLERCKNEMQRLNGLEDTVNRHQMLFGINQGAIYTDIRIDHAKRFPSWIWTAMRSADLRSARHTRRCTMCWMRPCLIFR